MACRAGITRSHSTWAIATVPQKRDALWPGECCIWEAADPYLYMRTTPDGRVICGGEDEEFSDDKRRDALIERKTAMLRRKLHRLFPKLDTTVEFAWTGAFGETTTGLPIIGAVPDMPRCLIALGYGGNGTTYAAIAADVIAGRSPAARRGRRPLSAFRHTTRLIDPRSIQGTGYAWACPRHLHFGTSKRINDASTMTHR